MNHKVDGVRWLYGEPGTERRLQIIFRCGKCSFIPSNQARRGKYHDTRLPRNWKKVDCPDCLAKKENQNEKRQA